VRPLVDLLGRHQFNQVFFDNVRVPRDCLLGEINRGWYVATATLDFERSGIQRVIGFLLRDETEGAARESGLEVTLPAAKGVIASRLNLTQEHFSRILHELVAKGMIEVRGRTIAIRDMQKLRTYES